MPGRSIMGEKDLRGEGLEMFDGFDAPPRPVDLRCGDSAAEVWPEHGASIASFRYGPRALLRPTGNFNLPIGHASCRATAPGSNTLCMEWAR